MLEWIENIMENGYTDEHHHMLYGAAAISHFMNLPISSIDQDDIERGKKYINKYIYQSIQNS